MRFAGDKLKNIGNSGTNYAGGTPGFYDKGGPGRGSGSPGMNYAGGTPGFYDKGGPGNSNTPERNSGNSPNLYFDNKAGFNMSGGSSPARSSGVSEKVQQRRAAREQRIAQRGTGANVRKPVSQEERIQKQVNTLADRAESRGRTVDRQAMFDKRMAKSNQRQANLTAQRDKMAKERGFESHEAYRTHTRNKQQANHQKRAAEFNKKHGTNVKSAKELIQARQAKSMERFNAGMAKSEKAFAAARSWKDPNAAAMAKYQK